VILTPSHLAIVMEYAAGGELYERICNAGRFAATTKSSAKSRGHNSLKQDKPNFVIFVLSSLSFMFQICF